MGFNYLHKKKRYTNETCGTMVEILFSTGKDEKKTEGEGQHKQRAWHPTLLNLQTSCESLNGMLGNKSWHISVVADGKQQRNTADSQKGGSGAFGFQERRWKRQVAG